MNFRYRGLDCTCDVTPRVPATELQPPEGGEPENIEWEVADLDEVMEWLEVSEGCDQMIRACYKYTGALPPIITSTIDRTWNISDAAYEAAVYYDPRDEEDHARMDD